MSDLERDYLRFVQLMNAKSKGEIIYTGNPDFNERYISKKLTLRSLLSGWEMPTNLATREQEMELRSSFFEMIAEGALPHLKSYFNNKTIRRNNAKKPRKPKPTHRQLVAFRDKYIYDHGRERGWIKAASREFDLNVKTIHTIYKKNME